MSPSGRLLLVQVPSNRILQNGSPPSFCTIIWLKWNCNIILAAEKQLWEFNSRLDYKFDLVNGAEVRVVRNAKVLRLEMALGLRIAEKSVQSQ